MNHSNLDKTKTYLLACSYGPDSMAAFHLLLTNNYKFEVAIVNYHLREESTSEVNGLLEYSKSKGIKVHVLDVKEPITSNVENRCRKIRYNYFKELSEKYNYEAVITAHQQDDHIETYLLQKKRKILTKVYGISEISYIFGLKVNRPFLSYTKQEMQDICTQNQVPFAIDKTNLEDKYLRNLIRHNIVEKMSDEDRKKILLEIEEENRIVNSIFDNIKWDNIHKVSYVISLDTITYYYLINDMANNINPSFAISKNQGDEILKVLKSDKPNVVSKVYRGLYLIKDYDSFYFDVADLKDSDYSYVLDSPSVLDTEYFYLDFSKGSDNRNVRNDDYPIVIRNARPNDIYIIKGYEVKVRRLFIDWKLPVKYRKIWPVIVSKDNKVIYIPRYQKDFIPGEDSNFYVKLK